MEEKEKEEKRKRQKSWPVGACSRKLKHSD